MKRNPESVEYPRSEETGESWGFEERSFRLVGDNLVGFRWIYDDDKSNVYGRVWKTLEGAKRFVNKKTQGTFVVRTKI